MLEAGQAVRVILSATTVTFDMSRSTLMLTLTARASSALFVITAAYGATSPLGVLASGVVLRLDSTTATNTRVLPASLSVEVVARQFRIKLGGGSAYTRSPGRAIPDFARTQSVHETIDVAEDITIDALWVAVSITHAYRSDLIVELVSPEEMSLRLHDRTGGSADNLRRIYTARDDPLLSLVGTPARGEWVLTVGDYGSPDAGTLDAWGIGFGTPARVLAGASTLVTARLVGVDTTLGSPRLFLGEAVGVGEFEYGGAGVVAEPFTFTAGSTEVGVTLTASVDASEGLLFAFASTASLVNMVVEPAAWPVEVVARRFRLELDAARDVYTRVHSPGVAIEDGTSVDRGIQSVRSTINVVEGIPIEALWVAVLITHPFPGDLVIELISPGGSTPLRLHDRTGGTDKHLRRVYTARDDPLHSLIGTRTRGDWVLTVG